MVSDSERSARSRLSNSYNARPNAALTAQHKTPPQETPADHWHWTRRVAVLVRCLLAIYCGRVPSEQAAERQRI